MDEDRRFQLNVYRKLDNLKESFTKKFEDMDQEFVRMRQEVEDMKSTRSATVSFSIENDFYGP